MVVRELCKQIGWPARTYWSVEVFFAIRISEGLIWERQKAGVIESLRRDLVLEATRACPIPDTRERQVRVVYGRSPPEPPGLSSSTSHRPFLFYTSQMWDRKG